MDVPLISIIVPIYKAMPHLQHCLRSLLSQNCIEQMEIVCVDDCGDDGSIEYIEMLQQEHSQGHRLRLCRMPHNSGASMARNQGLLQAEGNYVGFVDADDWCEPDMYERLYNAIQASDADWAFCLARKEWLNGEHRALTQPFIISGEFTDEMRRLLLLKGVAYFWTGLYNREFLLANALDFPLGKFSEDSYFWWLTVMHTERIAIVYKVGYHYLIQDNSVSKRPDATKAEQKQQMYGNLLSRLRSEGLYSDFRNEIDYMYIKKGLIIPLMIRAINHPDTDDAYYHKMIEVSHTDEVEVLGNPYFKGDYKLRLLFWGFSHCPKLISKLLRLKYKQDPF